MVWVLEIQNEAEAPWVQLMEAKYFRNKDPLKDPLPKTCSWVWQSILKGMELVKDHYIWEVGGGENISVYHHNWIPGIKSRDIKKTNSVFNNDLKVSELIDKNSNSWNRSVLMQLFPQDQVDRILTIRISPGKKDKLRWTLTKCGEFTVNSAYK